MKIVEKDRILHIIFDDKTDTSEMKFIIEMADLYEGHVMNRQGFNFPMKIVQTFCKRNVGKKYIGYINKCDYVIAYKDGDILTKKHELQHAKYFTDPSFVHKVRELWDSFPLNYQKKVTNMLIKMGYPADKILDEFQAYYFTEKQSFFGKVK